MAIVQIGAQEKRASPPAGAVGVGRSGYTGFAAAPHDKFVGCLVSLRRFVVLDSVLGSKLAPDQEEATTSRRDTRESGGASVVKLVEP